MQNPMRGADSSIVNYVRPAKSEEDIASKCLPSGEKGPIWILMRIYRPAEKALSGANPRAEGERINHRTRRATLKARKMPMHLKNEIAWRRK